MPDTCAFCQYDLSTVTDDGHCPECGVAIRDARERRVLRTAPVERVRALARATLLIELSILTAYILVLARALGSTLMARVLSDGSGIDTGARITTWFLWVVTVLIILPTVANMVGWWRLTSVDPRFKSGDKAANIGRAVRVLVILMPVLQIAWALVGRTIPNPGARTYVGIQTALTIGGGIQFILIVIYLRMLASRLGATRLRRWATNLLWIGPVGAIAKEILMLLVIRWMAGDLAWSYALINIALRGLWLVIWLGTLEWLRRSLRQCESDQHAAQHAQLTHSVQ